MILNIQKRTVLMYKLQRLFCAPDTACICFHIKHHSGTSLKGWLFCPGTFLYKYSKQCCQNTGYLSATLSSERCLFHQALYFRPSTFKAWHFNGPNSHGTHLHVLFTPRCHFHFKPDLPICLCNTYLFAWVPFLYMQKRNAERDRRRRAIFLNLIWRFWEEKGLRGTTVPLVLAVPSWCPDDKCF